MPVQTLRPQLSAVTEKSQELSSHSEVPPLRKEGLSTAVYSHGDHGPVPVVTEPAATDPTMSAEMRQMFAKLIDEKGNLDMRNVTSLIWANRRDPALIKAVTEQLIENSNEQTVFNGIEFYLPQLAHMVVHLEVEVPTSALEQFALVICQQSLHVALQLNWILLAALEDYQPETSDGLTNPHGNTLYFARCAKLLQNVERIIALGSPAAAKLEELYYRGQLSKTEIERLAMQDRKKNARQIIGGSPRGSNNGGSERGVSTRAAMEGPLWHKRWHPRERPHRHQWIRRWFAVEDRVLYCYRMTGGGGRGGGMKRAIVLNHADVEERDYKDHKYPYYFEVTSPMGNMRLRADSRDDMERWITVLREEAQAPPVMHLHVASVGAPTGSTNSAGAGGGQPGGNGEAAARSRGSTADGGAAGPEGYSPALDLLSPGTDRAQLAEQQRRRYEFFDGQRTFVRSLTDVCEELRFVEDRSLRTTELEKRLQKLQQIPDICYLPLCKSTDPFRKVLRIPPGEARAFSTKARCPALVTFETAAQWVDGGAGAPPPAPTPASTAGAGNGAGAAGEAAATAAGKSRPRKYETPPLDVANYMYWTFCSSGDTRWHNMRGSMKALYGGDVHPSDLRLQQQSDRDGDIGSPKGISRLTTMLSQKMSLSHIVDRDKDKDGARDSRDGTGAGVNEPPAGSGGGGGGGHSRERHPARPSVWRERAKHGGTGGGTGQKSPFPNLSNLGSARFMRAPSFKGVTISMPSFGKKPEDGGDAASSGAGGGGGGSEGHPPRRGSWMRMRTSREGTEADAEGEVDAAAAAAADAKDGEDTDKTEFTAASGNGAAAEEGASEQEVPEPGPKGGQEAASDALADGERTPPAGGGKLGLRDGDANGEANGAWEHQEPPQGPSPSGSPPRPPTPPQDMDIRSATGAQPSQVPLNLASSVGGGSRGRSGTTTSVGTVEEDGKSDNDDSEGSESGDEAEQQRANAAVSYGETYEARVERLRRESPFAGVPGWGLERMICKSNDDLRQEVFIMQLISFYAEVFQKERLALWLKPYRILSTGKSTGLIEVLSNSISLDGLKKSADYAGSLSAHFERLYGPPGSEGLMAAQRRFAQSLAGYSVVCYLLRIKDRHNGNIMLTSRGRVIHIDFGFVLGMAPGNDFSFERAPFKLTLEYAEALGGRSSPAYQEFARLFGEGLVAARKYATPASTLIEIMMFQSEFPCFAKFGRAALTGFRERLLLDVPDSEIPRRAQAMVDRSYNYRGTRIYDRFQLATNKIQP